MQLQIKLNNSKPETTLNYNKSTRPSLKYTEYQTYVENFDFERMDNLMKKY